MKCCAANLDDEQAEEVEDDDVDEEEDVTDDTFEGDADAPIEEALAEETPGWVRDDCVEADDDTTGFDFIDDSIGFRFLPSV